MTNQPQTEQNCGHDGVDWNGEGDCIACARDKVLTEVNLCPNCYTMKHLTSSGVCGRCEPEQPHTELDDLLREYLTACTNTDGDTWSQEEKIAEAKQAIQAHITQAQKDLLAEVREKVIGDDEDMVTNTYTTGDGIEYYLRQERRRVQRNDLRAEQRAAIDEIEEKL